MSRNLDQLSYDWLSADHVIGRCVGSVLFFLPVFRHSVRISQSGASSISKRFATFRNGLRVMFSCVWRACHRCYPIGCDKFVNTTALKRQENAVRLRSQQGVRGTTVSVEKYVLSAPNSPPLLKL